MNARRCTQRQSGLVEQAHDDSDKGQCAAFSSSVRHARAGYAVDARPVAARLTRYLDTLGAATRSTMAETKDAVSAAQTHSGLE